MKKNTNEVLVSVYMTTYNQENYIARAIESIITQECDFNFELIIGEDCSTDNTRRIVEEYHKKYPEIIKPIFRAKNVGIKQNSKEVLAACSGKYTAFCEGDDYWTNTSKLQKQIDLMLSDTKYTAVYTRVQYVDANDNDLGLSVNTLGDLTYQTLLQINPVHTCSFLIEKSIFDHIDDINEKAPYGDYVMFLASSYFGQIGFLNEITAAYRKNVGIMHTWTNSNAQLMRLEILDLFYKDSRFKRMRSMIRVTKRHHLFKLTIYTVKEKKVVKAIQYYFMTLYYTFFIVIAKKEEVHKKISFLEYLKLTISVIPFSESIYRKLKRIDK